MLPYFRNYAFIAYVLAIVIPVGVITISSWVLGYYIVSTLPGLFVAIALLIACLLGAKHIVTKLADGKAQEMLALYNDACDPGAFVEAAAKVANEIRPPYDENGSWFLSFYALALDDLGRRDEAARIGQAMLSSAQMTQDLQAKAGLLVNIEPLVLRLFGAAQALEVVEQAEEAARAGGGVDGESRLAFLAWERGTLEALRDGDDAALIDRFGAVRSNPAYPLRVRVEDALLESSLHKARGDAEAERACLEFVVSNGNKLPAVGLAKERLA